MFLGCQPADSQVNDAAWRCLQFTIHQVSDGRSPRSNRIDFSRLECVGRENQPLTFDATSLASETLRGLVGEAILELTIKDGRLRRAIFDGIPLNNLLESISEVGDSLTWSGGFGITVSGGDATIRNARITILKDDR